MNRLRASFFITLFASVLTGCGGKSEDRPDSITSPNTQGTPSLTQLYAFDGSSTAQKALECSKQFLDGDSCDLSDIKPLGANISGDITLQDIEKRLVVSHDWMADSFIQALEEIDDQDLLNLFKPINAIVLSYDVRPSFYHTYTAAIYISPRYLWRNTEEWNTIYEQDDYRSGYDNEFLFDAFLRYVNPATNTYVIASNSYKQDTYDSRTTSQIAPGIYRILAHELAHANDFLHPDLLSSLGNTGKIYDDYISPNAVINDELDLSIPLASELLSEAAQIAYRGANMTERMRETTAIDAGNHFESDGAADLYGYSTNAEDVAMLFEAYMMYKKYGAVSDVAFVTTPTADDVSCNDYVVKWGQRNRLADSSVKQRAIFVGNKLLNKDITDELASIPDFPTAMATDVGWCDALTQTADVTTGERTEIQSRTLMPAMYDYRDDRYRH